MAHWYRLQHNEHAGLTFFFVILWQKVISNSFKPFIRKRHSYMSISLESSHTSGREPNGCCAIQAQKQVHWKPFTRILTYFMNSPGLPATLKARQGRKTGVAGWAASRQMSATSTRRPSAACRASASPTHCTKVRPTSRNNLVVTVWIIQKIKG